MRPRFQRRMLLAVATAGLVVGVSPMTVGAADPQNGFKTDQAAMILPGADAPLDMTIKPIITVGDMVGSYRFEAIPDGISVIPSDKNTASVFINH